MQTNVSDSEKRPRAFLKTFRRAEENVSAFQEKRGDVFLRNIEQLMSLQTQPPDRMLLDIGYHFIRIQAGTWLKKIMTGRNIQVSRNILSQINDFDIIHTLYFHRNRFRRASNPIDRPFQIGI